MTSLTRDKDELTLQAYCDGELDAAAMAEFERRLSTDAGLRDSYNAVMALKRSLRRLPSETMPPGLESRVKSAIGAPRSGHRWSWRALAACALIGVLAGSAATTVVERSQIHDETASLVVGNHIRGLLAPQPFDIASSDRHTVKPWFTTRLPESPQVMDLSAAGFILIGGRIDVIGHKPAATIVYKHAAHIVSLTTLPTDQAVPDVKVAGYRVLSWRDADFTYVAVSDISNADLASFQRAFQSEVKRP
ncbi:anti-sigma factor RsiW [Nitrobacteraceae bacterium AZCC 1564]